MRLMHGGEKQPLGEIAPHLLRLEMDEPPHALKEEVSDEDPINHALRAIKDISVKARALRPQQQGEFVNVLGTSAERIVRHSGERERAVQNIAQFFNAIEDPDLLRQLIRDVRGGNDKGVYKILSSKRDLLLEQARKLEQLRAEIEAASAAKTNRAPPLLTTGCC